jgi:hypothetical protein
MPVVSRLSARPPSVWLTMRSAPAVPKRRQVPCEPLRPAGAERIVSQTEGGRADNQDERDDEERQGERRRAHSLGERGHLLRRPVCASACVEPCLNRQQTERPDQPAKTEHRRDAPAPVVRDEQRPVSERAHERARGEGWQHPTDEGCERK